MNGRDLSLCCGGVLALAASARADTDTVCTLQLRGYAWGNQLDSNFRLESNRLAYTDIGLNGPMGRAEAGDIGANWNTLGLAGRGFQGVKYQLPGDKLQTSIIAGRVSTTDLLGQQESSSALVGTQIIKPLRPNLQIGAASLFTPDADGRDGPYVNTLSLGYNPSTHQNFNLELAQSEHGYGMQLAGSGRENRWTWRGSLRAASSGFSTATNPLLRTDRTGVTAYSEYQFTHSLAFSLSSQRYGDGFGGRSSYDSAGLNWKVSRDTRLNFSADASSTNSRFSDLTSEFQDIRSHSYGVQLSQQLGKNTFFLSYNRQNYQFPGSTTVMNGLKNDLLNLSWSLAINDHASVSLSQLFYSSDNGLPGSNLKGTSTAFDMTYALGRRGQSIGIGAQLQNATAASRNQQTVSPLFRFTLPLKTQDYLSLAYQAKMVTAGFRGIDTPDRLYITYSRRVQFGGPPSRAQILGVDAKKTLVAISGRAFDDLNGNGAWDPGESGVPGVTISLLNGQTAVTSADGRYSFKDLEPRKQRVSMSVKTLPLELTPLADTDIMLAPNPGQNINVNFPVARTGQINGIVFEDRNSNGLRDPDEPGIEGVVVRVEGSPVISFSGAEGKFRLTDLSPKTWSIGVDPGNLPENYVPSGDALKSFTVRPNQETDGALLGIMKYERPATQTFVFNKQTPPVFELPAAPPAAQSEPIPVTAATPPSPAQTVTYEFNLRLPETESFDLARETLARRKAWQAARSKPAANQKSGQLKPFPVPKKR